jgi:UDP-N-acetylglucosamine 2-epimerase (non-hydrolysing)
MKTLLVGGARPNFMKVAPIVREFRNNTEEIIWKIVHTGQHYDYEMSEVFFKELDIPAPDYFLGAGSGSHAEQTAKIIVEFEKVCLEEKPDVVLVVGDVNSTLACSVTAKKLNVKVAHVEAGLRSRDMTMPEEINRIVTDAVSDYLFVTEKSGIRNLKGEGRSDSDIFFVGNVMIDTLYYQLSKLQNSISVGNTNSENKNIGSYAVVTLHRPSNVDERETLTGIIEALIQISRDMNVILPTHPRTRKNIEEFGLLEFINGSEIKLLPPMPYMGFIGLVKDASLVLTDSGGLQEETTVLGIPCFTLRENTERPVTIEQGTNILVGTSKSEIISTYDVFKRGGPKKGRIPELWDGKAAERIVSILVSGNRALNARPL